MSVKRIGLIGFGEVGQILGDDLGGMEAGVIAAWDVQFVNPDSGPSRALIGKTVSAGEHAAEAVNGADLVISAVTAEQTIAAAESVAEHIRANAYFLDMNSASPAVKQQAADIVTTRGGRYVEAAVMSPFPPKRLATPILLGGPHAGAFLKDGGDLGFAQMTNFGPDYGRAAAAKMCRSVVVKGMEALLAECLLTARQYGVEDNVIASLNDLFPGPEWRSLAHYMISRSITHGARRAEEMREVARTVHDAGLAPHMSAACAERQSWAARFGDIEQDADLATMLDQILASMNEKTGAAKC